MSAQEQFKSEVVEAARKLVATAGLSHLPLLDALASLRKLHEQMNERDWKAFKAASDEADFDAAMQRLP